MQEKCLSKVQLFCMSINFIENNSKTLTKRKGDEQNDTRSRKTKSRDAKINRSWGTKLSRHKFKFIKNSLKRQYNW